MVLNQPIETVMEEFHNQYWEFKTTPLDYLKQKGCQGFKGYADDTHLHAGFIYFLTVPSLSERGSFHCVLLDAREEENVVLYDPGTNGRQVYAIEESITDPLRQFPLKSWVINCVIRYSPGLGD